MYYFYFCPLFLLHCRGAAVELLWSSSLTSSVGCSIVTSCVRSVMWTLAVQQPTSSYFWLWRSPVCFACSNISHLVSRMLSYRHKLIHLSSCWCKNTNDTNFLSYMFDYSWKLLLEKYSNFLPYLKYQLVTRSVYSQKQCILQRRVNIY